MHRQARVGIVTFSLIVLVAVLAVTAFASSTAATAPTLRICAGNHGPTVKNIQAIKSSCAAARQFSSTAATTINERGHGFNDALHIGRFDCTYGLPVTAKDATPLYSAVTCHTGTTEIKFDQIVRRATRSPQP